MTFTRTDLQDDLTAPDGVIAILIALMEREGAAPDSFQILPMDETLAAHAGGAQFLFGDGSVRSIQPAPDDASFTGGVRVAAGDVADDPTPTLPVLDEGF